ncbi:MAG TPA: hypothetical protein VLB84_15975 [Bacteroidia bacterium]|nr:hypothetical protein [Bacteroidia bacterium]
MKKLESLALFNEKKLSKVHKSQILGGAGIATQGGTRCTMATSTGCQSYASDSNNGSVTTYNQPYGEVSNPCNTPTAPGNTGGGLAGY